MLSNSREFDKCRVGKAKNFLTRFNTEGTVKLRVKNVCVKTICVKKQVPEGTTMRPKFCKD